MTQHGPSFESFTQTGFDINAASNSTTWDVAGFREITVQGVLASGSWATAIIQAQCSADGTNFVDISGQTLTAAGIMGEVAVGTEFFRVRVSTQEGGAGTVDLTVNAKR